MSTCFLDAFLYPITLACPLAQHLQRFGENDYELVKGPWFDSFTTAKLHGHDIFGRRETLLSLRSLQRGVFNKRQRNTVEVECHDGWDKTCNRRSSWVLEVCMSPMGMLEALILSEGDFSLPVLGVGRSVLRRPCKYPWHCLHDRHLGTKRIRPHMPRLDPLVLPRLPAPDPMASLRRIRFAPSFLRCLVLTWLVPCDEDGSLRDPSSDLNTSRQDGVDRGRTNPGSIGNPFGSIFEIDPTCPRFDPVRKEGGEALERTETNEIREDARRIARNGAAKSDARKRHARACACRKGWPWS